MRNIYFICILAPFLYSHAANGQYSDVKVVATTGNSYILNTIQLDWTLGEVVMHTLENGSIQLTEGMQQPVYELISFDGIPEDVGILEVYPNPVQDVLKIVINLLSPQKGVIELYDLTGIKIWSKPFSGQIIHEEYRMENLPSGQYLLGVVLNNNHFIGTHKISKF